MLPKAHVLYGFLFAYIIYWFTSITIFQAVLIFLASVLIDFDHYLYYVIIKKRISLKSSYNWFKIRRDKLLKLSSKERKKHKQIILLFHGVEPIIILFLLSQFFPWLIYINIGFIIHLILDLIVELKGIKYYKLSVIYSIYDHILKRKLKHL
tara:strand:- start:614 stop:1069 length:456 start_codon:yes stop_codon:yes gene_type:complete